MKKEKRKKETCNQQGFFNSSTQGTALDTKLSVEGGRGGAGGGSVEEGMGGGVGSLGRFLGHVS